MDVGRPSIYSDELANKLCEELSKGRSLKKICLDDGMPCERTVMRWLADGEHNEFCQQYAQARNAALDVMADEVLEIADEGSEDVQRDRLRFDARRWYLSKLAPRS